MSKNNYDYEVGLNSLTINTETVSRLSTPTLVREYRMLHVAGSHRRLTDSEACKLTTVVTELRFRGVLN